MSVKFIHVRQWDKRGAVEACGGKTVAYKIVEDTNSKTVVYGIAKCHVNDNYSKAVGRDLSLNRMSSEPYVFSFPKEAYKYIDVESFLRSFVA